MLKIGVCGIGGKMGRAVLNALMDRGHSLGAAFETESYPHLGKDAGSLAMKGDLRVKINPINNDDLAGIDGVIDFSNPKASLKLLDIMKDIKKPFVIGTTGFTDEEKKKISDASKFLPVLFSPNMSLGVNLLFKLTELASKVLANDFDIEVFEAHHKLKLDAPSGTAKKLLDIIQNTSSKLNNAPLVYDRTEKNEQRSSKEIGVQVLRGGDIVGEHTVYFVGMGERIELTHKATSRDIFARGALTAMEFLASGKGPGLYDMNDVLGL
ncbi:MAG: 4-hydroxy-tetrahydrodipicolinate reductase [Spirochaetes bacterium]|nr:4-hydroxy-tetrahydrodipicolinate reductase [Spirochaetota bacterium]